MTSTSKHGARAIADLSQGTILATVEIAATRERVFRALTDPKEVVRWWGSPETYQTTEWTSELREGGAFRARGRGADGNAFEVVGEYLVVEPPHKLVHTWRADWDGSEVTTVTFVLDATQGGTRVTLRHEGFGGRPESCSAHGAGWEMVLSWLDAHARDVSTATTPSYYLCKLLPPRPTFPADMTAAERAIMQEHVAYWTGMRDEGVAVAFGPVLDPKGAWGAGVIGVISDDQLRALQANDPAIRANVGFGYEAYPMPGAIVRPL
ncbi:MAG: SRPBCC domain-containing protein [Polyangiales bacterium]